ncbi:hypothetical protein [Microbacterium sp.]|uniref:coiled-coil domain-containing protein n=1 Tax=Microbacterium sp. TaxID=51671 RepID=UPI002732B694|nr:hypothetical protein [Microbacterium sp.]MDP3950568.1 hypothetical protein [Microbacterium sp.]
MVNKETIGSVATKELISYAVLTAHYNQKPDSSYLDNFVEFVSYALATGLGGAPMTSGQVAAEITKDFGLVIPSRVAQKILTRGCEKARYEAVSRKEPRSYKVSEAHSREVKGLEESVSRFEQSLTALVLKLGKYAHEEHADNAHVVASDPAGHLTSFIEANVGSVLSTVLRPGNPQATSALDGTVDFVVSSFIEHLHRTDTEGFTQLADLTKGVILAGVLNTGSTDFSKPLGDLTVVLDGPLILSILGYRGDEFQQALTQTVELALACGAKVAAFQHSIEEARAVLEYTEQALRGVSARIGLAGDVELTFRAQGKRPADVAQCSEAMDHNLRALHIGVQETPEVHRRRSIDESGLEDLLEKRMNYRNPAARVLDVRSIAAVDQLRGNRTSGTFESSRYVFITDNDSLAHLSNQHTRKDHRWPLVMTTSDLASLLWVRQPNAGALLPDMQLLAVAHAGLQPRPSMWKHYLSELERLESAGKLTSDEGLHLRTAPEARAILRRTTAGGEKVTPEIVQDVRRKVEDQATAPIRAKLEETSEDLASQAAENEATRKALEEARRDRDTKSSELQNTLDALKAQASAEQDRKTRIESLASQRAHKICVAIRVVAIALFVAGITAWVSRDDLPIWAQELVDVGETVVGVIVIGVTLLGVGVLSWLPKFKVWLTGRITARRLSALGYET